MSDFACIACDGKLVPPSAYFCPECAVAYHQHEDPAVKHDPLSALCWAAERRSTSRARVMDLEEALRNTLAVLLTYDIIEEHGVVVQARAALSPRGGGNG